MKVIRRSNGKWGIQHEDGRKRFHYLSEERARLTVTILERIHVKRKRRLKRARSWKGK